MIKKGTRVRAIEDHYDDHYGDIFISRGDRFEILDHSFRTVILRPLNTQLYPGEHEIHSLEEMFHACED